MGYTTTFEGEFHCYRAESPQIDVFLKAVRANEAGAMEMLADWLIDQGDRRGEEIAGLLRASALDVTGFWRLFGLRPEHAAYLRAFRDARHVKRDASVAERLPDPVRKAAGLPVGPDGAYFVGGKGYRGQEEDRSVVKPLALAEGQPGWWCQWRPNDDGTAIVWDGGEKFYHYVAWLEYLLEHFLGPWGYLVNGKVTWQGEEATDKGTIVVTDNKVVKKARGRHR